MITFFACPKSFDGHINIIQRNAIKSWTLLRPKPEIMLVGIDKGVAEICEEFGLIHIPGIDRNEYGTPLVNSIFQIAQEKATYPIVCYINSDIILTGEFVRAVQTVAANMPKFLILGQRTDIDIKEALNFTAVNWEADLKGILEQQGSLHNPTGIDFFCFPRGMYTGIPPFAIGRLLWDNWLVWRARTQGFPIVDITEAAPIVHQNHEYAPDKIRKLDSQAVNTRDKRQAIGRKLWFDGNWNELGPETQYNIALVPVEQNLNIWAATWMIDREARLMRRRLTLKPAYWYFQIKCIVPVYWPVFGRVFRWILSVVKSLFQYGTN